jgi:drug/metabolite transporter (DMT)-like permease
VKLTTVAAAAALVATQPVWQALIAFGQGRRLPWPATTGIVIAVAGAVLATGADFGLSTRAVIGDLLAIAGGMAGACYTALGERARVSLSTTSYTAVCYSVCAVVLVLICLIAGVPLTGYPASAWVTIVAITVGPQLLGHSLFNFTLRKVSATTVSMLMLLEVPGAAVLAWLWLGQAPSPGAWPGLVLLMSGVLTVVLAGARSKAKVLDADELNLVG